MRGLGPPERRRCLHAIVRGLRNVEVRTWSGIILGRAGAYDVDLVRCDRVATRIVRGLAFLQRGRPLPPDYDVTPFQVDGLDSTPPELVDMARTAMGNGWTDVGAGTYRYCWARSDTDAWTGLWLLAFYGRIEFVAVTRPRERPDSFAAN